MNLNTKFLKFLAIGVINTTINYFLFALLYLTLDWHYLISGTIGFLSGAVSGYILNRRISFKSKVKFTKGGIKYLLIQIICLALHVSIQYFSVSILGIMEIYSQIIGIVFTTFLNFFLINKFVFSS